MSQLSFIEPNSPVPAGDSPSWFTDLGTFLEIERYCLAQRFIPRPFDLDPCGHPEAPVSRLILGRGGSVYTAQDDGLTRSWSGHVVFVNPPYDFETIHDFAKRLAGGDAMHGRALHCPAWTDRGWWQDFIEPGRRAGLIDVRFHRGRLRYGWPGNPAGIGGDSAQFPSADVIWK